MILFEEREQFYCGISVWFLEMNAVRSRWAAVSYQHLTTLPSCLVLNINSLVVFVTIKLLF